MVRDGFHPYTPPDAQSFQRRIGNSVGRITEMDMIIATGLDGRTIDLALRGYPFSDDSIARQIVNTALKLNYHHRREEASIGVIVPDSSYPGIKELIGTVAEFARCYEIGTLVKEVSQDKQTDNDILTGIKIPYGKLLGVVMIDPSPAIYENSFAQKGVPVASVNLHTERNPVLGEAVVEVDNFSSAYQITNKLIDKGHRNFIYLADPQRSYADQQRRKGIATALTEHTGNDTSATIAEGSMQVFAPNSEAGYRQSVQLLRESGNNRYDVLITYNDAMALGAMKALREFGVTIPQQISVIALEETGMSVYSGEVPLAVVDVGRTRLGWETLEALFDKQKPYHKFIPEGLYRESVK